MRSTLLVLVVLVTSATTMAQDWLSSRTQAVVGASRVIAFRVGEPAPADTEFAWTATPAGVLEMLEAPTVLSGESIGYCRVRGLAPGEAALEVEGARLVVDVVEDDRRFELAGSPRIVAPATGAVAWGVFAASVEMFDPDGRMTLRLIVDGAEIEPVEEHGVRDGPWRTARFDVDAFRRPAGALQLTPVGVRDDGVRFEGETVTVRSVHPTPGALVLGEAETVYDVERPQRFRDERRSVGRDRQANGGAYFSNASAYPAVCFPVTVESPGMYQMIVRAAGSIAGGAPPTVGVVIDGANQPVTNGRLASSVWHRAVIGVPFSLDAGEHVLTPYFVNDFYVPEKADRNLRLDSIEVLRVGDASGEGPSSMMMEAMAPDMQAMLSGMELGARAPEVADPFGLSAQPLRIAFETPLDGRSINGDLAVRGWAWWPGAEAGTAAPMVEVRVNGEVIDRQHSGAPYTIIDAARFAAGENTIQLMARREGATAATPVQRVWYSPDAAGEARTPRKFVRYSMHDADWDEAAASRRSTAHYPAERISAGLHSNGSLRLTLPKDLAGRFTIGAEIRGDHFEGAPIAQFALEAGGETTVLAEHAAPGWWGPHAWPDVIELPAGEKTLVVSFTNDAYQEGRGDRNLWVQSVMLREAAVEIDRAAPVVDIHYPAHGQRVHMADAVIATVSDDQGATYVELLIDDVPVGMGVNPVNQLGEIAFPLLLRELEPGEATVSIRAVDAAGNVGWSEHRRIVVTEGSSPTTYERAATLLNRFGYGPDPLELRAILTMGEEAWLRDRLTASASTPGELAALAQGVVRFPSRRDAYSTASRAIHHSLLTPNPVRMRFVLWCENHFSTWIRKVEGDRKWDEHVTLLQLGPARFQELLAASAHSPAMLRYLDQDRSYAGRINENYAREIMELHTLGVEGDYDQGDVTTLAHLLTGWTASEEGDGRSAGQARAFTFRYDPALNDEAEMRVVGRRFGSAESSERYDRVLSLIETLSAHPDTASFVCGKLVEHYVGSPADEVLTADLAAVFVETGGDMTEVLIAMSRHERFWSSTDEKMAQPIDYAMRLGRTSGFINPWQVNTFLSSSGAGLFDRSTPDGYPEEDAAYADSNALVQRWRLARTAQWSLVNLVPGPWRWGQEQTDDARWAQRVVDVVAVRLTGSVLGEASNEAATSLLMETEGNRQERAFSIAPIIAQMPEASLR